MSIESSKQPRTETKRFSFEQPSTVRGLQLDQVSEREAQLFAHDEGAVSWDNLRPHSHTSDHKDTTRTHTYFVTLTFPPGVAASTETE